MVTSWEICEIEPGKLAMAFRALPPVETDDEREKLIQKYLHILHLDGVAGVGPGKVINGTGDIEGYEKNPLDPDLESTVCPPYTLKGHTRVFYTYQRVGGAVTRYRFRFDDLGKLKSVDINVLGKEIGAYVYMI